MGLVGSDPPPDRHYFPATTTFAPRMATAKPVGPMETAMSSKRELIERDGEKYFVRRDAESGQFMEWDKVSRSLPADRRQPAKKTVPPGQGDRGDQRRKKGK